MGKGVGKVAQKPTAGLQSPIQEEGDDMDDWLEEALKTQTFDSSDDTQPQLKEEDDGHEEGGDLQSWLDSVI